MLDPVSGGFQVYTWAWDTGWLGARQSTTDPTGTTLYEYTPLATIGGFGWPTKEQRTWTGGPVAARTHQYDAHGRLTRTTWPTGAIVDTTYHPEGPPTGHTVTYGTKTATVTLSYDTYDRPNGWALHRGATTWTELVTYDAGDRVGGLVWTETPGTGNHTIDYDFFANGWPLEKRVDGMDDPFEWTYDPLGRVASYSHLRTLEAYTYDDGGNPLTMARDNGVLPLDEEWGYSDPPKFAEIPLRSRTTAAGQSIADAMAYDDQSRLAVWDTSTNGVVQVHRTFDYDGAGRLRQSVRNGTKTSNLKYDVDDQLVWEQRLEPGANRTIYRFGGWRKEGTNTIETVLPMARLESGKLRVVYTEPDGHANWTVGTEAAQADTTELLGVYGLGLLKFPAAGTWTLDGFHGSEPSRTYEVMQFGARHALMRDGMWMQPEPLLYLGLTNGDLASPLAFGGLYASGQTSTLGDPSGRWLTPFVLAATLTNWTNPEITDPKSQPGATVAAAGTNLVVLGSLAAPGPEDVVIGAALTTRAGLAVAAKAAKFVQWAGDKAADLARVASRASAPCRCFVAGAGVVTPTGIAGIEAVGPEDLVVAASSAAESREPLVELDEARPRWRGVWAPRALGLLLASCGPQLGEPVQTYDARTGFWNEAPAALEVGDEYLVDGHLYRVTADGVEDRGEATVDDLAASDQTWVAEAAHRVPDGDEWVLVLGAADDAGHWRLAEVEPGERVAFQGRVFDTADADADGRLEVRASEDVIGRVYQTHVRHSDTVIDLVVSGPSGPETITGTPEHPFWVPAVGDYVPLGELQVGTVLRTAGGGEARVATMAVRHGDFEVFNFEVEGARNYYVQGRGGAGDAVLVHNGCGFTITPMASGREMLGEAVGNLRTMRSGGSSAADMADAFEDMAGQINKADPSWGAARMTGADGSHVFAGEFGESLVISADGRMFRGSMQNPQHFTFGSDGSVTPVLDAMKEIQ